jgi:hypothetical protein
MEPLLTLGQIHPVRFVSRKLSPAELNYNVYDKQMSAVVFSLRKSRHYLHAAEYKTTIFSDHHVTGVYSLSNYYSKYPLILPGLLRSTAVDPIP